MTANSRKNSALKVDVLQQKLMFASGMASSIFYSFDEKTGEPRMPGEKLMEAITALETVIGEARSLANQI